MSKSSILNHLKEIAFFLEIRGANPFKIRAFQRGPQILKNLSAEKLLEQTENGDLIKLDGVGKGILNSLQSFVETGTSEEWEEAKADLPSSLRELADLKGLGPKKIKKIYEELHVQSLGELEYACNENRLALLKGFGEKTQKKVLDEIQSLKRRRKNLLLPEALEIFETIKSLDPAGLALEDLALKEPVLKSLCFGLKKLPTKSKLEKAFSAERIESIAKDWRRVYLQEGRSFDLLEIPKKPSGLWLMEKRSPKAYFSKIVKIAQDKNIPLENEKTEEAIFEKLGLAFEPPEARHRSPQKKIQFLEEHDLTGVFHAHTVYSDGSNTLEEMAEACRARQWRYLGISEHSQTAFYADGLKEVDLDKQWKEIDTLNKKWTDFKILKGIESDILKDGKLDYPASILKKFDFVIASIHQRYGLKDMTERLIRAIENPCTTMIGHWSGRLLLARDAYDFDEEAVIEAAIANNVIIELNANPHRLDMDWKVLAKAAKKGLLISINPDAHSVRGFEDTKYGIWMARKAGVPKKQIFNTWQPQDVEEFLAA